MRRSPADGEEESPDGDAIAGRAAGGKAVPQERSRNHPAKRSSATIGNKQRVLDEIRRDIVFGVLPAGARITEQSLAEKYGLSRMPVREALKALESEGFVESQPYVGSTVSAIPVDEAEDLFAVREVLEAATARRAAERAQAQQRAGTPDEGWWAIRRELADLLDLGDDAVARGRLDLLPDLNSRFHLGVAALSASRSLTALLRQIEGKIEWLYASDVGARGKRSWTEHREILAHIDAGDADRAARSMGRHVGRSRDGYLSRFSGEAR